MGMDAGSFIALLLGSSVLSAVITQLWNVVRDHFRKKREAAFSALYVAIALEAYASECASLIQDSSNFENSGGHAGTAHGNVADFPDYPDEIEWKPLGIKHTTKVMSYRVDVETTRTWFKGAWEFGDEDDIVPEVRERSASLGVEALAIAAALRAAHRLLPVSYEGKWDIGDYLATSHADHVARRALREERQRKFNADMWGKVTETDAQDASERSRGEQGPVSAKSGD